MQHRHAPEALDRTLQDIRNRKRPFGGITVVFGGDFQQCLPVVVKGTQQEIVQACVQRSDLWNNVEILRLQQNMRLENNREGADFAKWLLDVGSGHNLDENDALDLLPSMISPSLPSLIDFIYSGIGTDSPPPPDYFVNRTILAARNADVDGINADILERMSGMERVYASVDAVVNEAGADASDETPFPIEFLRSLSASGLPPGELHMKLGCPLMLLRNLDPARGLCNGTRMILTAMRERVLEVHILGGDHDGEIAFIPRITLTPSEGHTDFTFILKRRQFPVRLAFAMTINKAQGQSVKHVGLDLRMPVFSHGQLYVALSRATSANRVKIILPDDSLDAKTPNIVYKEVLLN